VIIPPAINFGIHPNYRSLTNDQQLELHRHAREAIEEANNPEALEFLVINMALAHSETVYNAAENLADLHMERDILRDRIRKTYLECAGAIALAAAILVIPIIW
jgi:uncharacterized protein with PhoU and TrkA domain